MPFWGSSSAPAPQPSEFASDAAANGQTPPTMSAAPGSTKAKIMEQVQQEAAISNARNLVSSINHNCFEKCVPKPGSSLSSGEESCLSMCMEKYMATWNATSRAYIQRLQQEQAQRSVLGGLRN